MMKKAKIVLMAVFLFGAIPSLAAYESSHSNESFRIGPDIAGPKDLRKFNDLSVKEKYKSLDSDCHLLGTCSIGPTLPNMNTGQEGGGAKGPIEFEEFINEYIRKKENPTHRFDVQNASFGQSTLIENMNALGFKVQNAMLDLSSSNPSSTEAGYGCQDCNKPGQEGGGQKGYGNGFKVWKTKVIGEDDRIKVTGDTTSKSVPRVECSDYYTGKTRVASGIIVNKKSGLIWSTLHQMVNLDRPETKEAQLNSLKERCSVNLYDGKGNLVFKSKIEFYKNGDIFNEDIGKSYAGDFIAIKLKDNIPSDVTKKAIRVIDEKESIEGMGLLNVGYQHIPDNPNTPLDEETAGLYSGKGTVKRNTGGPGMSENNLIFQHDIDVNGLSSGSGIYFYDSDQKQYVLVGMQVGDVGVDFKEYHYINQYNVGRKFTSDIANAFKQLISMESI